MGAGELHPSLSRYVPQTEISPKLRFDFLCDFDSLDIFRKENGGVDGTRTRGLRRDRAAL